MRRVSVMMLLWVVAIAAVLVPGAHAAANTAPPLPPSPFVAGGPRVAPSSCVDVLLMGFRGSGEQPRGRLRTGEANGTAPLTWTIDDFLTPDFDEQRRRFGVSVAQDRLGHTLGALYEAMHHRLRAQGRSVGFWSVGVDDSTGFGYGQLYGAPPVDVVNLGRYVEAISLAGLTRELMPVVRRLVAGDAGAAPWCPDTQIVFAGFSQGAVLARALATNLHRNLRGRTLPQRPLADLILIGDPLFRRQEHVNHGVVHPSDHQMDGLLRIDLVGLCDRSVLMRSLCAMTATGSGSVRSWFREVWHSLQTFARRHPHLLRTSVSQLSRLGTGVHVLCDSGDVVCSPVRVISTLRWDSDFPELLRRRPEQTIHGSYHRTVPWEEVVDGLHAARTGSRL